jgi:uracil-DNA glycosylase
VLASARMTNSPALELLRWYVAMGADEAIDAVALDRLNPAPRAADASPRPPEPRRETAPRSPLVGAPVLPAQITAPPLGTNPVAAASLAELEQMVRDFEGCSLKRTATTTVFADGAANARLMIIGEAPGADEDRIGRPFVGRSGQLLDRMLASIGHDRRSNAYITNILFWRPPGNRKPTSEEIALCLPFTLRHIALVAPAAVMLCGGTATSALLGTAEGIMRLRGRWFDLAIPGLASPVPCLATYHPSFLLRSPARKGEAWSDLLALQARLES